MKTGRTAFLLLLFGTLLSTASAQTLIGRQRVDQLATTAAGNPTYALTWLPTDYATSTTRYPLIVFLHGSGENGTTVSTLNRLITTALPMHIAQGWDPVAVNPDDGQTHQFIVVSPQAPSWSYGYTQLQYILPDIISRYRIDTSRIYVTGLSAGGAGTWATVTNGYSFARRIAAVVPVAAAGTNTPAESNELPYVGGSYEARVWTICGTGDSFWNSANTFTNTINTASPAPSVPAVVTGLSGGHSSSVWNLAYNPTWRSNVHNLNIYEWMLKARRPALSNDPSANAGPDQVIGLPQSTATLSGSASAISGRTITQYSWTRYSGPACTITNANSATATLSGLTQGTYVFRLVAKDNLNATSVDDMQLTVLPALSFTPIPALIQAETWYQMSGVQTETTTDAGGGQNVAYIDNGDWMEYPISVPAAGVYSLKLRLATNTAGGQLQVRLIDNSVLATVPVPNTGGWQSWQTVTVNVTLPAGNQSLRLYSTATPAWNINWLEFTSSTTANQAPVVNAGPDQTITLPVNAVTLTGTATDADGSIAAVQWSQVAGPSAGTLASANNLQTNVTALTAGTYRFELRATDNVGAVSRDTVQVSVLPAPNQPPAANAGADQDITLPTDSVNLNGSGTDPDGTISSYQWTMISGPSSYLVATPATAQTMVRNLVAGTYQFRLTVTDNSGAQAYDTVAITVNPQPAPPPPVNQAPTANGGADQLITLPQDSVLLNGTASDVDGTIVSSNWTRLSGPAGVTIATPASLQTLVRNLQIGTHVFVLSVTDNDGAVGHDTVTVTVNAAPNQPPAAQAGADTTIYLPANTVALRGSGTDGDGTITSYQWSQVAGPSAATLTNADSAQATASALVAGTYRFLLTVTDNAGATATDEVQVTVASCGGVRRVVTPWADGGRYFSGKPSSPHFLNINPGDTLVLRAANNTWSYFSLEDLHGSAACPVVITNEGGQVQMTRGIEIRHCSNLKATGSGSADTYGFYIHNPAANDNNGVAIAITGRTKNIEVERVFVRKKTYGSWIKEDGSCIDSLNYPNFRMDNIRMHDCKFVNIGQSAIYAGNTAPTGSRTVYCNGQATNPIPMRLSNILLYNNIIDSTMRSAIQLGGADSGYNAIYNNIISRTGYERNQQQGTGISIGGMTRNCHVYNNDIRSTFLYGIFCVGVGDNYIENNRIDSSGYLDGVVNIQSMANGIFVDTRQTVPFDSSRVHILNNRIGLSASQHFHDIFFNSTVQSWATGNRICGNTKLDGTTPARYYLQAGIHYTTCQALPPGNQAPIANAGLDQVLRLPVNSTILYGSMMDDGPVWFTNWSKISGPSAHLINPPNQPYTRVYNLVEGVYQFELRLTDHMGAIGRDTVTITVLPALPNTAPVANAGSDQAITLPSNAVTLSGSATDADGTITTYAWARVSGPAAHSFSASSSAQTQVTGLVQGVYAFELTVTDNLGGIGKDTVIVTVNPSPNVAPVANAGPDQTISLPTNSVTLSGTGTDTDGTIASYLWTYLSGPAGAVITSAGQAQTTVTGLVQGVYRFELLVQDNSGATARDTVQITVDAGALPPPVNQSPLVNAGADQVLTLPVNATMLHGSASDPDGNITGYQWTRVSGPASYLLAQPGQAATAVSSLVEGVYLFALTVTDNNGATASDTLRITVHPAPNQSPVVSAGPDRLVQLPLNAVLLQGSASDPDGSITAYQWTRISGPAIYQLQQPTSMQTMLSNLVAGTYLFRLQVTDNAGATAADTVTVTVLPMNLPPVVNAGRDTVMTLPVNSLTLSGSAFDQDGQVVTYRWSRIAGPQSHTITSPNAAQTVVGGLTEGVYLFELVVTDNGGAEGRDTVRVTVNPDLRTVSTATIYPNPVASTLNLKIDAVTNKGHTSILIFDMTGRQVYGEEFTRTQQVIIHPIQVSRLLPGTYTLQVTADLNRVVNLKFIKE